MILKSLILKNFRSYQDFKINFDNNLNVIIGKNDIGKSTLLEALEIFFNCEKIKIDIEDLCVNNTKLEISIILVFEIEEGKKYTFDTIPTSIEDEHLLNKDGLLEIHKIWDCSKDKITASSLKQYIKSYYPVTFKDNPLICLKNSDIKKIYKDYKEAVESAGLEVRETTNSEMRQAIYKVSSCEEFEEILIPIDKIDGKDVWSSMSIDYPMFFLFQSDRANKDTDKEVQDPLRAITKTAIDEVIDDLEKVKKLIEESATKIGIETIHKLAEMNPELANVLRPDVSNKAWDSLFSFSFIGDDNIPMNKRGSGVRRLILLNYFRAEAERQNKNGRNIIYAIEEPETSQHPDHQHLLIEALCEIANKEKTQVIITTHSPEVAKVCKDENLLLITKVEGKNELAQGVFKLKQIVNTLGIAPYLSKLVICVEGENDRNFLYEINQNIPELKEIIDLKSEQISIIPMQGSNLKTWVEREYLKDSNVIEYHLYDRDSDEKYKEVIESVNEKENKSFGQLTLLNQMENYIHFSLYESEFGIDCSTIKEKWHEFDVPIYVRDKCARFVEKNKKAESIVKQIANSKLSKQMNMALFTELGVDKEIKGWFEKIKSMYEI
ncbi:MAG: AAA family ATPase [Bacteroidota bacterium]|nr:AAA family ATPase [Bacteroidota bacterium]